MRGHCLVLDFFGLFFEFVGLFLGPGGVWGPVLKEVVL